MYDVHHVKGYKRGQMAYFWFQLMFTVFDIMCWCEWELEISGSDWEGFSFFWKYSWCSRRSRRSGNIFIRTSRNRRRKISYIYSSFPDILHFRQETCSWAFRSYLCVANMVELPITLRCFDITLPISTYNKIIGHRSLVKLLLHFIATVLLWDKQRAILFSWSTLDVSVTLLFIYCTFSYISSFLFKWRRRRRLGLIPELF